MLSEDRRNDGLTSARSVYVYFFTVNNFIYIVH